MDKVPDRFDFPKEEEKILQFWKDIDAFKTSVKLSEGRPHFTFYDGPPFATGLPHYGHVLAGTIKDIVTRYAHNTGHYVERRFGWDCHGLPIEFEIDKKYNIKTREEVLEIGIGEYNERCRSIVMTYSKEWETIVGRLGRWIDFENDYKTMDINFMESVWWVFKTIFEKGLVYQGFKVMPYSTGCTTPLSNFEANQNYQEVVDKTVVASFPLVSDPEVSFIAWTTTPWTLPSNLALCVNPKLTYVKLKDLEKDAVYIMMKDRTVQLYKDESEFEIIETYEGSELLGLEYVPLFNYFSKEDFPNAFKVIGGSFVTNESGTGIVHCAPAFGEEDFNACISADIVNRRNIPCPIDDNGRFTEAVPDFQGLYIKVADGKIIKALREKNRIVHTSSLKHKYPFCWRSDTPLIYRAVPSWFVAVEEIKDKLVANNEKTYWVPDFVKSKRFKNWLLNARDWAISRNRYWGTPIPIWMSEDGEETLVVGSVAELEELTGKTVTDLHKHHVDDLVIISPTSGKELRRVEEVFDCWFESGSMPYAQQHYPFENKEKFEENFPADFIAEGIDQTRGWFYTLLVLSTALFDKPPFKNLIVNGMVLAGDGKKMSKRLKNYPPVQDVVNEFGADALRLYLINSPVVRAQKLKFKQEGVLVVIKEVFLRWYNAYRLFVQTVRDSSEFTPTPINAENAQNLMDRWVLAYSHGLIKFIREEMEHYRLYTVVPRLVDFITDLANWYVRLNRTRLKGGEGKEEQNLSLSTLFSVLMNLSKMMAPFTPFFVENLYQNLVKLLPEEERLDSIHYTLYPDFDPTLLDEDIERAVKLLQSVIELGRVARERRTLPLKTPIRQITVYVADEQAESDLRTLESYVLEELNTFTMNIVVGTDNPDILLSVKLDGRKLGPKLGKDFKKAMAEARKLTSSQIIELEETGAIELAGHSVSVDELTINRTYGGDSERWEAVGDKLAIVLIDTQMDEELILGGFMREVMNRVQRLRKEAGLVVSQRGVEVYYSYTGEDSERINIVLEKYKEDIQDQTGTVLLGGNAPESGFVESVSEVGKCSFTVKLVVPEE